MNVIRDEDRRIPSGYPASALPGYEFVRYEAKKSSGASIRVPPGWKRLLLPEKVLYFSPSGIRLRSLRDVREYLSTEGTCKCGLECGVYVDKVFDFDHNKQSEVWTNDALSYESKPSCNHRQEVMSFVTSPLQSHIHNPIPEEKKGKKKKKKKNKIPYAGLTMSDMVQAKEAEKQRINEIISQQKREYEDQLKHKETTTIYRGLEIQAEENLFYRNEEKQAETSHARQVGIEAVKRPVVSSQPPALAPAVSWNGSASTMIQRGISVKSSPQPIQLLPPPAQQPVMQLVNTINGPVLMQTLPLQVQQQQQQTTLLPPAKKRKKTKKLQQPISQVLLPPHPVMATTTSFQGNQPLFPQSPQNLVVSGGPTPVMNQVILPNGLLMQAPVQQQQPHQQIVYNQFPEGSVVQFQQPPNPITIQQHQQPILTNPSQPTFIMTPTGQLLPSSSSSTPPQLDLINNNGNNAPTLVSVPPSSSPSKKLYPKKPKSPPSSPPKLTKEVGEEEVVEFEEDENNLKRLKKKKRLFPAALKKNSPPFKGAFIQSNQVDSSGLKATPPHTTNNDSTFDALVASVKDHPSYKGVKFPNRVLFVDSDDSDYENVDDKSKNEESPSKKKRKKRSADYLIMQEDQRQNHSENEGNHSLDDSGSSSHNPEDFKVGDLVWGSFGAFPSWPGKLVRGVDENGKVLIWWFGSKTITEVDPTSLKTLSEGFDAHHKERKKMRKSRKLNAGLEKAIQEAMMELDNEEEVVYS